MNKIYTFRSAIQLPGGDFYPKMTGCSWEIFEKHLKIYQNLF